MIITVEGERKGEREIKRTHKPGILCFHKSITLVMSSPLLRIGPSFI
jgi:hypothetical protein